ncbi:MAG: hypothetical protein K2K31_03555, partial [Clostridia bacterium]|nr:hypothetical protein [Clostridia bacterium]
VYRYLERISGAIDKIIMKSALGSSNIIGQNYFYNNVFTISQKLIDLSERKVTLINLKVLIESVLAEMDKKDAQILIERYFDGTKAKVLAESRNISIRTVFRKIADAEKSFTLKLHFKGFNDLKLNSLLSEEEWIKNVYRKFSDNECEEIMLSKCELSKAVSM